MFAFHHINATARYLLRLNSKSVSTMTPSVFAKSSYVQKVDSECKKWRLKDAKNLSRLMEWLIYFACERASVWAAAYRNLHLRRRIQLSPLIVTEPLFGHNDDNPLAGWPAVSCGLPAPQRIMPTDNLIIGRVDAAYALSPRPSR